jgi:hypothetical protein
MRIQDELVEWRAHYRSLAEAKKDTVNGPFYKDRDEILDNWWHDLDVCVRNFQWGLADLVPLRKEH